MPLLSLPATKQSFLFLLFRRFGTITIDIFNNKKAHQLFGLCGTLCHLMTVIRIGLHFSRSRSKIVYSLNKQRKNLKQLNRSSKNSLTKFECWIQVNVFLIVNMFYSLVLEVGEEIRDKCRHHAEKWLA